MLPGIWKDSVNVELEKHAREGWELVTVLPGKEDQREEDQRSPRRPRTFHLTWLTNTLSTAIPKLLCSPASCRWTLRGGTVTNTAQPFRPAIFPSSGSGSSSSFGLATNSS